MTHCKICKRLIKELGREICVNCEGKMQITKGWHFTYQPPKKEREKP